MSFRIRRRTKGGLAGARPGRARWRSRTERACGAQEKRAAQNHRRRDPPCEAPFPCEAAAERFPRPAGPRPPVGAAPAAPAPLARAHSRRPLIGAALALAAALLIPGAAPAQDPGAAQEAWLAGDTARAERLYAEILRADSSHYTALHRMALLRAWAERYDESLRLFDRMLRLYPAATDARIDRARVLAWRGDLQAAVDVLEEVLEGEPENVPARVGLARTLRWQGRHGEAREQARHAIALDPASDEAREELREAERVFAPSTSPAIAHEADSDGNRMTTASASARLPLEALALRVDVYARDAREIGPADLARTAAGAALTGQLQVGRGWGLAATVGASAADAGHPATPSWAASLGTPAGERMRGSFAVRRQAFDATARLMENGVATTELTAGGSARLTQRAEVSAAAGMTWLEARSSGEENRRWSAHLSASYDLAAPLTLALAARGFGFERDLNDGYFDPDFFGLAELLGQARQPFGPVELSVEGAPGLQRIGAAGDIRPVGRVAASIGWRIGAGRELTLGGVLANAGLSRLSPAEDADYRYRAFTGRFTWTF